MSNYTGDYGRIRRAIETALNLKTNELILYKPGRSGGPSSWYIDTTKDYLYLDIDTNTIHRMSDNDLCAEISAQSLLWKLGQLNL